MNNLPVLGLISIWKQLYIFAESKDKQGSMRLFGPEVAPTPEILSWKKLTSQWPFDSLRLQIGTDLANMLGFKPLSGSQMKLPVCQLTIYEESFMLN